jgi:hypothetical protein
MSCRRCCCYQKVKLKCFPNFIQVEPYLFFLNQGSHIKIRTNIEMPVQVDGEPWLQPPGDIVVLKSALKVRKHSSANIPKKTCRREKIYF